MLRSDSQLRNADVELQQRAVEYLRLSCIASADTLVSSGTLWHAGADGPTSKRGHVWCSFPHCHGNSAGREIQMHVIFR